MAITTVAHPELARITVGVDTHGEVHVAHAKDGLGRRLATVSVPTTPNGYAGLLAWARAGRSVRGGRHRFLRGRADPLPPRRRPGRARGQPARSVGPPPTRQV